LYHLRILDSATRELERLDKPIGRRVVARLNWLAANVELIKPKTLTGEFAGLYKLRVGDYRVLYEILREEQVIVIHIVGHRREIYREK
jgi:mRNA interferase RelE/StbE